MPFDLAIGDLESWGEDGAPLLVELSRMQSRVLISLFLASSARATSVDDSSRPAPAAAG